MFALQHLKIDELVIDRMFVSSVCLSWWTVDLLLAIIGRTFTPLLFFTPPERGSVKSVGISMNGNLYFKWVRTALLLCVQCMLLAAWHTSPIVSRAIIHSKFIHVFLLSFSFSFLPRFDFWLLFQKSLNFFTDTFWRIFISSFATIRIPCGQRSKDIVQVWYCNIIFCYNQVTSLLNLRPAETWKPCNNLIPRSSLSILAWSIATRR